MRRFLGVAAMAAMVGGLAGTAHGVPATAAVHCVQVSPANTPGSCTYKATAFQRETLTAAALKGYTIDWVSHGEALHYACTSGACRIEPGRTFTADPGTTIHITVTQGVVVVRQVAAGSSG